MQSSETWIGRSRARKILRLRRTPLAMVVARMRLLFPVASTLGRKPGAGGLGSDGKKDWGSVVSQKIAGVKGMNDILPPDIYVWQHVEAVARDVFRRFGYAEIRTPMVEDTALFVRTVGESTDIVGKEMYTFEDKAGRSLSLRPEGTAPAARAYIEHAVYNLEPITRWSYFGPMFRYERMKTGRYRQFF